MRMRHRTLNDDTREVDIHDDLLPISHDFILDIVQYRADQANDKRPYTANHVNGFLVCLYGGAQFKEGTDLWATAPVGMMPPPRFREASGQEAVHQHPAVSQGRARRLRGRRRSLASGAVHSGGL